ncbi:anthranilate phosphoribosyltransferase [Trichophyton mentagrophytes]|uniref:Anthranilate phosphoribosyltransferase n=1 Tax=Trichophyton interdigitale (strain MR816) TaxID=1215338 RepID=A0A059JGR8_TRIIM|nr:anthranilate phosphoribosyltransferase [Trichophyton interdigitale H6]KAG5207242.1 Anthranilate phosphoribosyl transferase [Trichophyton interdigitale]KDB27055.1 anthranilate phosphoribosyltransferase [Trichophyton interdigitale MR816]GBF62028.1 anthranilate phosphoribosyltransferase [Trichophyton mentagrophytes]KAG5217794.1 Anthranilate phosphoribosyl transferase [Trichophyton interdigitale]
MAASHGTEPEKVSISPLLKSLAYPDAKHIKAPAGEIAAAFALIFEDRLSAIQTAALLTLLHSTGLDKDPDVIAQCSHRMREAATPTEKGPLLAVLEKRGRKEGSYNGGLCDIVGTGGDHHSTFNISTTSSIVASPFLMTAKHGNRAQTSFSGSADVLMHVTPTAPKIEAVNAGNLAKVLEQTNYAFLFAPVFHPGMMYANPVRRGLGLRTIFNLMGPLANPVDWAIEARVVGVAYQALGPVFADALRLSGVTKAMVVCGEEDLDEISCAGKTNVWRIVECDPSEATPVTPTQAYDSEGNERVLKPTKIEKFSIEAADFGLPPHPLSEVGGGKGPQENALKLISILRNELPRDDPILHFVLMNVAGLLAISGVCEADTSNMGPGDDGKVITERGPGGLRWKEGLRRARWAIESGEAYKCFEQFIKVSNTF